MSDEPDYIRDQAFERALPNSAEAERALLGSIQNDNSLFPIAIQIVVPDDFYVPSNKRIYLSMVRLFEVGSEINAVLIAEDLKQENQLDSVGGIGYILGLTSGILPASMSTIESYCQVIRDKSIKRKLIKEGNRIVQDGLADEDPAEQVLERAGHGVFGITLESTTKTLTRIGLIAHKNLQKAHIIQQQGTAITGVPTGFNDMDALTLGHQPGDMVIIAARPSMGKTAVAVMLALNAAINFGKRVAFFSLEMSEEQIGNRMLCAWARVDLQRFRSGHLTSVEWDRLAAAEEVLSNAKIFIDDTPGIGVLGIKAKCRRLVAEEGPLDEVIADYLQLMDNDGSRQNYNREQEVSKISKDFKKLCRELNVPGLALSQLSRKPEERADKRPQLADLRESGSLEQDADVVWGLYREDVYKRQSGQPIESMSHIAEMILLKQRNGPTGVASLRFDDPSARFENLYQN